MGRMLALQGSGEVKLSASNVFRVRQGGGYLLTYTSFPQSLKDVHHVNIEY